MRKKELTWDSDILVTVRVERYSLNQFVKDCIEVAAVTFIILNYISKKYLKKSLRELWRICSRVALWMYWTAIIFIFVRAFIDALISLSLIHI